MKHDGYHRYHIETKTALDISHWPNRFQVRVKKYRLLFFLIEEILRHPTRLKVIFSRPCIYEVYGRPVGGMAPREHMCVGCLRCTTEHPDWVTIYPNPEFNEQGDSYFATEYIDAVHYETQTGQIPVKGAGFRGRFGGEEWNSMWTDMSEIVRPTRDGIHGREFISTVVDIGEKPTFLTFDDTGLPVGKTPAMASIPLPILFDTPPASVTSQDVLMVLSEAARESETLAIVSIAAITKFDLSGNHIVPLITPAEYDMLLNLQFEPKMIEMSSWDEELYTRIRSLFPSSQVWLRLSFEEQFPRDLLQHADSGIRTFHLTTDYHGRGKNGTFMLDLIRKAHQTFVDVGRRDEITLLGSGGIIAAEHVPKAIICGLDAVALDTSLLIALEARMVGECTDRATSQFRFTKKINVAWGVQRLKNLLASWRDQMLEVLGAMGLREVRRLRGEIGRAMFQKDLEREAFKGITGYEEK